MGIVTGRVRLLTQENQIAGAPLYNDVAKLLKFADTDDYLKLSVNANGGLQMGISDALADTLLYAGNESKTNWGYINDAGGLTVNTGYCLVGGVYIKMDETTVSKSVLEANQWTDVWCVVRWDENESKYKAERTISHTINITRDTDKWYWLMCEYGRNDWETEKSLYNHQDGDIEVTGVWI